MPRLTKVTAKERAAKFVKVLHKAGGNQAKAARKLGVTRQTVQAQTKRPEVVSLRQQAIEDAAKAAGLTLKRIYGVINDSLDANVVATYEGEAIESDAPDHRARLIGSKIGLELFQHMGVDTKDDLKPTEIHVHYGHRVQGRKAQEDQ